VTDLHRLPGEEPDRDTILEHGELITAVELPPLTFAANSCYRKVRDRASYAFALVSVAAALDIADGSVRDVRIAMGGVAHKPWRARRAEEALLGGQASEESFQAAAETELAEARPLPGNAFKIPLARNVMVRMLMDLAQEHRRTTHRLAALDVPPPTIMRAPGETQGMFAFESAMDEMAIACGLDPIEFRIRNEPAAHPESGLPFSSRNLVGCLREGASRFRWRPRDPAARSRRDRDWLVGTGVAASTYPTAQLPGSAAAIRAEPGGRYTVSIAAADIGTGTWTALRQIAADALGVAIDQLALEIGDSALPPASPAGLSSGISCWGSSIVEAARRLRGRLESQHGGIVPTGGLEVTANMPENPDVARYAMHAFGAQFAEVRVNQDTGEVRVPRLLGVFDAGRIINPKTARSQLIGGMTQELSLALHEHSILDPRFGHVINHDFSGYHIASNADAVSIDAHGRRHRQRRLSRHRHPRA